MATVTTPRDQSLVALNIQRVLGSEVGVHVSHVKQSTIVAADVAEEDLREAIEMSRYLPPPVPSTRTAITLPHVPTRPQIIFWGVVGGGFGALAVELVTLWW